MSKEEGREGGGRREGEEGEEREGGERRERGNDSYEQNQPMGEKSTQSRGGRREMKKNQ